VRKPFAVALVALVCGVPAATAKKPLRTDFAAVALNILPPGQSGSLAFPPTATDQAKLYDALTAQYDQVTASNYASFYKSERFGLAKGEKGTRVTFPRKGLTIVRDRWDVPHVYGRTRAQVEFGAGWATAQDRLLLMQLLRGPGRIAAVDVPGVDPFAVAFAAQEFVPSAETEAELTKQVALLRTSAAGRRVIKDIDAYLAGINGFIKSTGDFVPHWTRNDVIAIAALIGARFGVGGGDEARRSAFLSALQTRLGTMKGQAVFDDLREEQDPETPVSVDGTFSLHEEQRNREGNVVLDDGSLSAAMRAPVPAHSSNALLVAAKRSKNGHPLMVAGPQVGYAFPELLTELDLHGGGIDARGAAFPGISFYILIGRGKDYAWSPTSAGTDIIDQYVETLCGGDDVHYLYQGQCRAMGSFTAGVLKGKNGAPDRTLSFRTTVHGPVVGYARSGGTRVAVSSKRSTRGREALSVLSFERLNTGAVHSAREFLKTMSTFELTFNWFYEDSRDIAMFSTGRVPLRAPGVDLALPTKGTGEYEWRGFVSAKDHPQGINPSSGAILNWNNKPGRGWASGDDAWHFGSVHRVDLLRGALPAEKVALPDVVRAMNVAATRDLRVTNVWPAIARVLSSGPIVNAGHAAEAVSLLARWAQNGGSRVDRDADGKIDDPGAALMDAAWPKLTEAALSPVLGPLTGQLARLMNRDDAANPGGSSYYDGWYGYLDKDLRSLLGQPVQGAFATRFCGGGDLAACRNALGQALDAAYTELLAAQGTDSAAWRADATKERITFGLLPATMRWTNRPTFQQVITFDRRRP
jgi:acyl-homoserine lactone acylase PvdQ